MGTHINTMKADCDILLERLITPRIKYDISDINRDALKEDIDINLIKGGEFKVYCMSTKVQGMDVMATRVIAEV